MEEVWEKEWEKLNETCLHRFRTLVDFNQWLFRDWQLAAGHFAPRSVKIGQSFLLSNKNHLRKVIRYIDKQKGKLVCINDAEMSQDDFLRYKSAVNRSFNRILPCRSGYEKEEDAVESRQLSKTGKRIGNQPIDIVIAWVDGGDPEWRAEKDRHAPGEYSLSGTERYRDWDQLRYIFRGIERFAPWVNNVFLVTWGHLPRWLEANHPKLRIVNHADFIPPEYLPTFNANPIELNFHRIKGLSEHFVYFNDDMFLIRETNAEDFFKDGRPCDSAVLTMYTHNEGSLFGFPMYRSTGMLNKYFTPYKAVKSNFKGWFYYRYGKKLIRTFILLALYRNRFFGIMQHHLPTSLCKSTMEEVWGAERDKLNETCLHKFRTLVDFNQWLFRDWQLASGNFSPRSFQVGKSFMLSDENQLKKAVRYIEKQKGKMICVNDCEMSGDDFIAYKTAISESFEKILPTMSGFEKSGKEKGEGTAGILR